MNHYEVSVISYPHDIVERQSLRHILLSLPSVATDLTLSYYETWRNKCSRRPGPTTANWAAWVRPRKASGQPVGGPPGLAANLLRAANLTGKEATRKCHVARVATDTGPATPSTKVAVRPNAPVRRRRPIVLRLVQWRRRLGEFCNTIRQTNVHNRIDITDSLTQTYLKIYNDDVSSMFYNKVLEKRTLLFKETLHFPNMWFYLR